MSFAEGTPTVEITLGGRVLQVGWTWGAKKRLRDHLKARGVDLQSRDAAVEENLPVVVWAGLEKEVRETISVDEIAELINPRNEEDVVATLLRLFTESEPEREPEGNRAAGAVREPTPAPWISNESAPLLSSI